MKLPLSLLTDEKEKNMKAFKKYALLLLFLTIVFAALAISTYAAKTNTESEAN